VQVEWAEWVECLEVECLEVECLEVECRECLEWVQEAPLETQ